MAYRKMFFFGPEIGNNMGVICIYCNIGMY